MVGKIARCFCGSEKSKKNELEAERTDLWKLKEKLDLRNSEKGEK